MSIKASIAEKVVNARQWFSAFTGPCLYLAGFAALAGIGVGAYGMNRWNKGDIEELRADKILAQKQLSDFKADIATQSSTIKSDLIKVIKDDASAQRLRDQEITAAVDSIPAKIDQALSAKFKLLGSKLDAPQFNCIRTVPLPADFLRAIEQPAGNALRNGSVRNNEIR